MPRSANYKKIFICIVSPLLGSIIVFQNLFSVQYDISDSCLCTVKFLDIICIQKLNFFQIFPTYRDERTNGIPQPKQTCINFQLENYTETFLSFHTFLIGFFLILFIICLYISHRLIVNHEDDDHYEADDDFSVNSI